MTVTLPAALVRLFPGAATRVEVEASDVAGVIDALDARWPGMRARLCVSPTRLRRHINVFAHGERASLATPLPSGSHVTILTALVGG